MGKHSVNVIHNCKTLIVQFNHFPSGVRRILSYTYPYNQRSSTEVFSNDKGYLAFHKKNNILINNLFF